MEELSKVVLYYLTKGLNAKKTAILYSCITILIGFTFTALYSNTIYTSLETYFMPQGSDIAVQTDYLSFYVGIVLAVFAGIMFFGGGGILRNSQVMLPRLWQAYSLLSQSSVS